MNIAIIGSGSWGTALAQVLCDNNHDVTIYGINQEEIDDINSGYNTKFFKDTPINPNIKASSELKKIVKEAQVIVLVVPTKVMKSVLIEIAQYLDGAKKYFVNASKGFDPTTNDRMSNTIRDTIDTKYRYEVASVIGPSHAEEVILRMQTAIASVSVDLKVAEFIQKLFSNDYIRLYTLQDEIGAEYGVAIKNVLAICSGIISGLGLGDNARAALLTRGLQEMIRYGVSNGGNLETYLGLTGIGDLIVTATSEHSRNYQAGYQIGRDGNNRDVMCDELNTVEGIRTCKVIFEESIKKGIELPIINECYYVLFENKDPRVAIDGLMKRSLKSEGVSLDG